MKPIEPVYRLLGARSEQIRTLLGWTQQELADKTKFSRGSIANIEIGRQRLLLHEIETFSAVFNTTPKKLMQGVWI